MKQDHCGQRIYTPDDLFDYYMRNGAIALHRVLMDNPPTPHNDLDIACAPQLLDYQPPPQSASEWDARNQQQWLMPPQYLDWDVAEWTLAQCTTEEQLQRCAQELLLYQERGMMPLLQYMRYLVDTMRSAGIVWGVGRGSSVASYVLYLIGVHKIDSLYWDLPINEFLKD